MTTKRTAQATWPVDQRKLLPESSQRAAFRALIDARDLLADIGLTCKLLGKTAFEGQQAAADLSLAVHTALLELDVALGEKGVVTFATPHE